MARPHIDYLQSQTLPWQPSRWPHLPGCQIKLLSRDPGSGAASLLVRFPSGWVPPGSGYLGTSEELFVVEGMLELGGRRYGQDCYGYFPAAYPHATRAAPDGAVALIFYDADADWTAGAPPAGPPLAQARLIDAFELPWIANGGGHLFGGEGHRCKPLHGSLREAAATLLIASPPHLHPSRWLAPQEIHSCAEEMFVLSGDFLSSIGQMSAGAYCWRPAGVAHGPYGSRGGNLVLLRTHGAPLSTAFTSHEIELPRAPQYQPLLPADPPAHRAVPWRPQRY
jgi:hypothetical protein